MQPTTLQVGNVERISGPSAEQVRHYLRFMPPTAPFIILARDEDTFMQATPIGVRYRVEYREQGIQRYLLTSPDEAEKLLESYRVEDASFVHRVAWRRLGFFSDPYSFMWRAIIFCLISVAAAAWGIWSLLRHWNT